jgi:hypothetical protein
LLDQDEERMKAEIKIRDRRKLLDEKTQTKEIIEETEKRQQIENREDALQTKLRSLRPNIKGKSKIINTFTIDGDSTKKMPKFMREDFLEKRCKDIMTIEEAPIEKRVEYFWDPYIFLSVRKAYNKYATYFSEWCKFLVVNSIWDNMSLLVIILNSVFIMISDPNDDKSINALSDTAFLFIYTFEMVIKIFAFGLIFCEGAYLRDFWNVMDFVIIDIGLLTFGLEEANKAAALLDPTQATSSSGGAGDGVSALRAFRILRPLRTVRKIESLKSIMTTLVESFGALGDTVIVVSFILLIFGIAGLQVKQNY